MSLAQFRLADQPPVQWDVSNVVRLEEGGDNVLAGCWGPAVRTPCMKIVTLLWLPDSLSLLFLIAPVAGAGKPADQ